MNELIFLGYGAAFNYDAYNTSAFYKKDSNLYLFDCGESICNQIIKHHILDGISNIYVFITHMHSDHIGSLSLLMFYNYLFKKANLKIYYKDKIKLYNYLKLEGVNFEFEIFDDFKLDNVKVEPVIQQHIESSYGYFFYSDDLSFFYSGDTSKVNLRAIKELEEHKIDYIYHEFSSSNSPVHTKFSDLLELIPPNLRQRCFVMHLENDNSQSIALNAGFKLVKLI